MKFLHIVIISIICVNLVLTENKSKKSKGKQWIPDQFGRNYRKPWPDPSFNPLPQQYATGPVGNYALFTPHKYLVYNSRISDLNRYYDNTGAMLNKAAQQSHNHNANHSHAGAKKRKLRRRN